MKENKIRKFLFFSILNHLQLVVQAQGPDGSDGFRNTQISCGVKRIKIIPGIYNFTNEIKSYKIGNCEFPVNQTGSETEIVINIKDNKWIYECGFEKTEISSSGLDISSQMDHFGLNETEWDMKYITFVADLIYNPEMVSNGIIFAESFQSSSYTQKLYCHFEQLFRSDTFTFNMTFVEPPCGGCPSCVNVIGMNSLGMTNLI